MNKWIRIVSCGVRDLLSFLVCQWTNHSTGLTTPRSSQSSFVLSSHTRTYLLRDKSVRTGMKSVLPCSIRQGFWRTGTSFAGMNTFRWMTAKVWLTWRLLTHRHCLEGAWAHKGFWRRGPTLRHLDNPTPHNCATPSSSSYLHYSGIFQWICKGLSSSYWSWVLGKFCTSCLPDKLGCKCRCVVRLLLLRGYHHFQRYLQVKTQWCSFRLVLVKKLRWSRMSVINLLTRNREWHRTVASLTRLLSWSGATTANSQLNLTEREYIQVSLTMRSCLFQAMLLDVVSMQIQVKLIFGWTGNTWASLIESSVNLSSIAK